MPWSAGISNTAKVSYESRLVLLDRIEAIINGLRDLRQRAAQLASPQSMVDIAPEIDLPRPSPREQDELHDTSKRDDFPWLVEDKIPERGIVLLEILQSKLRSAELVSFLAFELEETWFVAISDAPDCVDPFQHLASMYLEEANPPDCKEETEVEEGDSDYDESFLFEDDTSVDRSSSSDGERWSGMVESAQEKQTVAIEDRILLTPWSQTFPVHLQEYLNQFDQGQEEKRMLQPPPGLDAILDNVSRPATIEHSSSEVDHIEFESEGLSHQVLDLVEAPMPPKYPVTTAHLLRLQRDVQQAYAFRMQLCKSMWDARDSLNRREDRYRMRETNGDITMVMRSRGFGSPLIVGTTVDQAKSAEEDEEEHWGLPAVSAPRRKIHGVVLGAKGVVWGDEMASGGGGGGLVCRTREVRW